MRPRDDAYGEVTLLDRVAVGEIVSTWILGGHVDTSCGPQGAARFTRLKSNAPADPVGAFCRQRMPKETEPTYRSADNRREGCAGPLPPGLLRRTVRRRMRVPPLPLF